MLPIDAELERVTILIKSIGGGIYLDRKYKDDLEWWCLGKMTEMLQAKRIEHPVYAAKVSPPEPDFITYDLNKKRFKPIEVGEVLSPGRRRGDEYKTGQNDRTHEIAETLLLDLPWASFLSLLKKKFQKKYDKDCWLLIYHNIRYSQITPYGNWHETILDNARDWQESHLVNYSECPYEKVFAINPSGKAMVALFPDLDVIIWNEEKIL